MRIILLIILIACLLPTQIKAQTDDTSILFSYDGTLYAQPINSNPAIRIGNTRANIETLLQSPDIYSLEASPIDVDLPTGYGFHHGVWSADRSQFAYLLLSPPDYQIRLFTVSGEDQLLLENTVTDDFGFLDVVGWTDTDDLLLLERVSLTHLHSVNLYTYHLESNTLDFRTSVLTGRLVGRTATLHDHRLFLGFDLTQQRGLILDTISGQISNITIDFSGIVPPQKGFDYYPIAVYGAINRADLLAFAQGLPTLPPQVSDIPYPDPFLHWALADHRRYITCYVDSEWTAITFATSCPGLAGRNYDGHQGTDISAEPDGLPIGTPVYPSAIGAIVASYRNCMGINPSCNNAYGNTVLMEHIKVVNNKIQIWYTGYGHLQMVLADDASYISDLTRPIALSGATGIGGAHLHFEVRTPDGWVDPWDNRNGQSLWLGDPDRPTALVTVDDIATIPKVIDICMGYADNNIRNGAGTTFDTIGKTKNQTVYYVIDIAYVSTGDAVGDWYEVLYDGGRGWLWANTLSCP